MSIVSTMQTGSTFTVSLQAIDAYGNVVSAADLAVAFLLGSGSGKGKFGKVTYIGNGIYQATFTPTTAGTDTILATISGAKVKSTAKITAALV
jgi:hypothetical protein